MLKMLTDLRQKHLLVVLVVLSSFFVSSCGLALDTEAKLARGEQAYTNGDYRAAIIDAKAVLLDEPQNGDARVLLGRASIGIGDGVTGEKELRRAVELGVRHEDVAVDLARALLRQGKFDAVLAEIIPDSIAGGDRNTAIRLRADALLGLRQTEAARDLYMDVLSADPSHLEAQLGIVNAYLAERNYAHARETLNILQGTNDKFIPAYQVSGMLYLQMGQPELATSEFRRAVDLARAGGDTSREFASLYSLAEATFALEMPDEVRPIMNRMQVIAPDDPRTMMVNARLAIADENWTSAQENLQSILRMDPDYRPAQLLLGVVHKQSGNLGQAEMYLTAVVAASPNNARARRLLAETRLELNKSDSARQALEPIVGSVEADAVSLSMAAGASLKLGDVDEAVEFLERAVASDANNVDLKIQLAFAYYRSGNAKKAQQVLRELPDPTGENSEFNRDSLLVLTTLASGNREAALDEARALTKKWPNRADAYIVRGVVEGDAGNIQEARDSFNQGLKVEADNVRLLRYLAQLDIAEGELESAAQRFELLLELDPEDSAAMVSLARIALRSEDYAQAQEWLETARNTDADNVSARTLLAGLHLASRRFDEAETVAQEAVDLVPDNARLHYALGLAQYYDENYRDAVFSFGKAAEMDPDEPDYKIHLARAQAARGNVSSAVVTLEADVDKSLQDPRTGIALAGMKAQAGDMEGAEAIARKLMELHPGEAAPYAMYAELQARQGNFDAAAQAYDDALDRETNGRFAIRAYEIRNSAGSDNALDPLLNFLDVRPLDKSARLYLANAYERSGSTSLAIAQYEQVIDQDPQDFVATNNLAWNYFISGDARAEEFARRAYEIRPDSGAVADTLGWILVNSGNATEGIPLLRSAVELTNNDPEVRFHLAAALAREGDKEQAIIILQEILRSGQPFSSKADAESLLSELQS